MSGTDRATGPAGEDPVAPLLQALHDLARWLESEGVSAALIGGVAASLLGRPRVTADVDALVLVDESDWPGLLRSGERVGFRPRHEEPLKGAHENRQLRLLHEPSGIPVDLLLGELPFEVETVERAQPTEVAGQTVPVATPEDLIVLKAVAARPRDIADIGGVLDAQGGVDEARVFAVLEELAEAADLPELPEVFRDILARRSRRPLDGA